MNTNGVLNEKANSICIRVFAPNKILCRKYRDEYSDVTIAIINIVIFQYLFNLLGHVSLLAYISVLSYCVNYSTID